MHTISQRHVPRSENSFERICQRCNHIIPLESPNCPVCSELSDAELALASIDQDIKRAKTERRHKLLGVLALLLAFALLVALFISAMPEV